MKQGAGLKMMPVALGVKRSGAMPKLTARAGGADMLSIGTPHARATLPLRLDMAPDQEE